ncbi:signal peptidase I [candidate division WWE3 bacterium]|nr:signal peptidase I [candidate division WWE3 bacterium]
MDFTPMTEEQPHGGFSFFLDTLINISAAVLIFAVIYFFVAQPHQVDGGSMLPTYLHGDYVLTEKVSSYWSDLQRGDVIVFRYPKDPSKEYIKRVIGLPGEEISIRDGIVYIDGGPLNETYTRSGYTSAHSFLQEGTSYNVQQNEYFVMGDNRNESSDSREWGTVPEDNIIGKVFFRYWPFSRFGLIKNN